MCGENFSNLYVKKQRQGSPPRVRGKPRILSGTHTPRRITPACAGKTRLQAAAERKTGDHPRVCGENFPRVGCQCPA